MSEPLLIEREAGTYYVGDLRAARQYLEGFYDVKVFTHPTGAVIIGEGGDTLESLQSWGCSASGDHDEAWRYFAGVDFGPVDDEYDEAELRKALGLR